MPALSYQDARLLCDQARNLVDIGIEVGDAICDELGEETPTVKQFTSKSFGPDRFSGMSVSDALTFAINELSFVEDRLELNTLDTALASMCNIIKTVYEACSDLALGLRQDFPALEEFKVGKEVAEEAVERSL